MVDEHFDRLISAFTAISDMSASELREVEKRVLVRRMSLGDATLKSFRLIKFPGLMDITLRTLFLGFKKPVPGGGEAIDLPVIFTLGDKVLSFKQAGVLTPPDVPGLQQLAVKVELVDYQAGEEAPLGRV